MEDTSFEEKQTDSIDLSFIFQNLSTSSIPFRLQLIKNLKQQIKEIKKESFQEVVESIFGTLFLFDNRVSYCAVEDLIRELQNNPDLSTVFNFRFLTLWKKLIQKQTIAARYMITLFHWSCCILETSSETTLSKQQFEEIVNLQMNSISIIYEQAKQRAVQTTNSTFQRSLMKNNSIFPRYVQFFTSLASISSQALILIGFLSQFAFTKKENLSIESRKSFLNWYQQLIISSPTKLLEKHNQPFSYLISSIQKEEFETIIFPSVSRIMKRSPEFAIISISFLFQHLKTEISPNLTKELSGLLLYQIKSSNEDLRKESIQAFCYFIEKLDTSGAKIVSQDLLASLKAKPPQWYERMNIYIILEKISQLHQSVRIEILDSIVDSLSIEANDESRNIGLKIFSLSLSKETDIPDKIIKLWTNFLKSDKEEIRRSALKNILDILSNSESGRKSSQFESFVNILLKNVKNPKPTGDAILSLAILLMLPTVDPSFEMKFKSEKVFDFLNSDSFLFKSSYQEKLKAQDFIDFSDLIQVIFNYHFGILSTDSNLINLCDLTIYLMNHPIKEVREKALKITSNIKPNASLSDFLLESFSLYLTKNDISSNLFYATLKSCVFPQTQPSYVGLLFLLAHFSPLKATIWKSLFQKISEKANLKQFIDKTTPLIVETLFDKGLIVESLNHNKASVRGFGSISKLNGESFNYIIPRLLKELETSESMLQSLSEYEKGVYNTPEGVLYEIISEEDLQPPEEEKKQTNVKEKKKRGTKGLYQTKEDVEWESKVKLELEAKKKSAQEELAKKLTEERLEKEKIVKETINNKITHALTKLEVLAILAENNSNTFLNYLPTCLPQLFQFIKLDFTELGVVKILDRIAKCCLSYPLNNVHSHLVQALVLVNKFPNPTQSDTTFACFTGLSKPTTLATFSFCFPICQTALLTQQNSLHQDQSMRFIELHTKLFNEFSKVHFSLNLQTESYPRGRLIYTLIKCMSQFPLYQNRAKDIFFEICTKFILPENYNIIEIEQILIGLLDVTPFVRLTCLQAIDTISLFKSIPPQPHDLFVINLFISCHDFELENSNLAKKLWKNFGFSLPPNFFELLSAKLYQTDEELQKIIGSAIADAFKQTSLSTYFKPLISIYRQNKDKQGVIGNPDLRRGVALTLGACASFVSCEELISIINFFINEALLDINEDIRYKFEQVGLDFINEQGHSYHTSLLPIFENFMNKKSADQEAQDRVRQSVGIFLGALAKHLEPENPKIFTIVDMLLEMLKTPSESVQKTVSKCLIPLMPLLQNRAEQMISVLLERLALGQSYGERKGAAYGLAGITKGLGISSLKKYDIMTKLQNYVEDKKHPNSRQGALFAFECLCITLERLFEPYIIQILPKLLVCFGDSSADVREATNDAARAIMAQLSAHGVKLVLPALLKALDDRNWRTKEGAIELLGSMAFCAPKQLSACLPTIVPRLSNVLTDSHAKVQERAKEALGHIGSVIRNPEIQTHVPIILKAIDDPDTFSKEALDSLIHTNFVHAIDAPSLALIIPILRRGLKDRSTEVKKKSAQIVGNMCSLTNQADLLPYLEELIGDLKKVLIDPIPEVRAITAKAFGSLVKGLGEEQFSGIVTWCLDCMKSEAGTVERSGAAQGLSEILAGLPSSRFIELLPDIIKYCNHVQPHIREGFTTLFIFLPSTMTKDLEEHLDIILPVILQGLSDEVETVRDIAMRAGQALVNQYAFSALHLLLPAIQNGLFHDNWRIRQSSITLLGDFLEKIISVAEGDPSVSLTKTLGQQKKSEILSALYMMRVDVSSVVRQKSITVWKNIVANTPKTLREILPVLMSDIVESLGSRNIDKREVAGRTLGDLTEKLADVVMPQIVPIIEERLQSEDPDKRQGVIMAVTEVLSSLPRNYLSGYSSVLFSTINSGLCDSTLEVQEAAAQAFDALYKSMGNRALEEILDPLLLNLKEESEDANKSLNALKQILTVRSNVVLPFLVPKLLSPPVTPFNVQALASVAEVAGPSLNEHLEELIPALLEALIANKEILESAKTVILSIQSEGLVELFSQLIKELNNKQPEYRAQAAQLIGLFCEHTKLNLDLSISPLLTALMNGYIDPDPLVQSSSATAIGSVIATVKKENASSYLPTMLSCIESLKIEIEKKHLEFVPGFCLPKALAPILPLFLNGLLYGSAEAREQAATGLGEIIALTPEDLLKPHVVQITGPLIRIVGDKFSWQVKVAILETLNRLIVKGGAALKPFLPQLQTTFVKSLQDPTRTVRTKAASALGSLMTMSTRVDSLVLDLLSGMNVSEEAIKETMLNALYQVLKNATQPVSPPNLEKARASILPFLEFQDENARMLGAKALGVCAKLSPIESVETLVAKTLLLPTSNVNSRHGYFAALKAILHRVPSIFDKFSKELITLCKQGGIDEKPSIQQIACLLIREILLLPEITLTQNKDQPLRELVPFLAQLLNDPTSDVKINALNSIKQFAKKHPKLSEQFLDVLVPPLMVRVKERTNFPVKLASERATLHVLQIHKDPNVLQKYSQTIDKTAASNLTDYCKRVLSKLKEDSEDEDQTN